MNHSVNLILYNLYLDDLVLCSEACSLCWRVFIHGSDELARFGLLTVQVEAVAAGSPLHVAETWPRSGFLLLHTQIATVQMSLDQIQLIIINAQGLKTMQCSLASIRLINRINRKEKI